MVKKEIKDIASSVKARLTARAKEQREDVQSVLVRYGVERFLYRLSISPHKDRFLLKGAALFSLWFDAPHRPTKDLDLLGFGSNDIYTLEDKIRSICKVQTEDGLEFLTETVRGEQIRKEEAYQGVRIKFVAKLGQARIPLQVDVGFGDVVTPEPRIADFPTLLEFPAPRLKVYPKETVVAEKFEAMVKLGEANGRLKDFWDLNYMIAEFEFDGELLQSALRATFENRQSPFPTALPIALRDEFAENAVVVARWRAFINRNRIERSKDPSDIIRHVRAFLEPIIKAEVAKNLFSMSWQPGRGWS
ncbi:MAG: nucleotidyl transferase AbiEii/AbiGii toxin family protein [Chloracidobacterium sp.]|nr:nucleotidyl transferase AbiEii/AbiGii toxin family protein [Chloracidobacterium sp.]